MVYTTHSLKKGTSRQVDFKVPLQLALAFVLLSSDGRTSNDDTKHAKNKLIECNY